VTIETFISLYMCCIIKLFKIKTTVFRVLCGRTNKSQDNIDNILICVSDLCHIMK
jgi:hypothetical protein